MPEVSEAANGKQFPNPEQLTSPERVAMLNQLQSRKLEGEILTIDELRFGVNLMRTERKHKAETNKSKKPAVAVATPLSDF